MKKRQFTDQMGRQVQIKHPPGSIVSLVPSQTELLFDLGLEKQITGITKFCIHPKEKCQAIEKIGGTKTLNIFKIKQLQPDLIIGNREENERIQIEELANHIPVWMSDMNTLDGAFDMIERVAEITGTIVSQYAKSVGAKSKFQRVAGIGNTTFAYFIWNSPMMVAANNTFIHSLLTSTGMKNIFGHKTRYPQISPEELKLENPDVVLLSTEPFPFGQQHIEYFQVLCPNAKVMFVDGEMCSWFGSRLWKSAEYIHRFTTALID